MESKDIKLKHKVRLRKKSGEIPYNPDGGENQKSHRWRWPIVTIIILCLLGFFLYSIFFTDEGNQMATETVDNSMTDEIVEISDKPTNKEIPEAAIDEAAAFSETDSDAHQLAEDHSDTKVNEIEIHNVTSPSNSLSAVNVSDDIEAEAIKTIQGEYGVYPERKSILGEKYKPIQERVNKLKRQGVF